MYFVHLINEQIMYRNKEIDHAINVEKLN
jgi:hypothetical protein